MSIPHLGTFIHRTHGHTYTNTHAHITYFLTHTHNLSHILSYNVSYSVNGACVRYPASASYSSGMFGVLLGEDATGGCGKKNRRKVIGIAVGVSVGVAILVLVCAHPCFIKYTNFMLTPTAHKNHAQLRTHHARKYCIHMHITIYNVCVRE